MKKLFVVLMMVLGLVGSAQADNLSYGPSGGSIQGREFWFNQPGAQEAYDKYAEEVRKSRSTFEICNLQKVHNGRRWETCRRCGFVTKSSYPRVASSFPEQCM